jgi:electron transport complex protein RnfG
MINLFSKHKDINEYIMPTLVLVVICLVVTLSLVTTYEATAPIIKETAEKEAEMARDLVLPDSGGFEIIASSIDELILEYNANLNTKVLKAETNIIDVYKANNDSGYVITSIDQGYGGEIKILTGFSKDGVLKDVLILEQKETPGLGTKVGDRNFLDQFVGLNNVESVDTISGATISSSTVIRAVASALEQMKIIIREGL